MFICTDCLDEFEGPAIDSAKMMGIMGLRSHGPCEVCHEPNLCFDLPSSADFQRKQDAIQPDDNPSPDVIDAFKGEFDFLSNFYVEPDGKTVEHFFQAAKATKVADAREIIAQPTARDAKKLGRKVEIVGAWDFNRDDVMLGLLRQKFNRPHLRAALLATGDAELIEGNTWGDTYWGCTQDETGNWTGENKLGKLLMQVRSELKTGQVADD